MPPRLFSPILLLVLGAGMLRAAEPIHKDSNGDPLPPGATARFGSTRLRHQGKVQVLAFSPDGKLLASGGEDLTIRLWEMPAGREVKSLAGHEKPVTCLAFAPDGKLLASGGRDGQIILWDIAAGREIDRLTNATRNEVVNLAFAPDGKTLAGHLEGLVCTWDVESGWKMSDLKVSFDKAQGMAYSPDGRKLAFALQRQIRLFEVASGEVCCRINSTNDTDIFRAVAFAADGKTLTTGDTSGTLETWNATTGERQRRFPAGEGPCLALTADGQTLAVRCEPGFVTIANSATRRGVRVPHGTRKVLVETGTFSPDGRLLATGDSLGRIRLWDVATGKEGASRGGTELAGLRLHPTADGKTLTTLDELGSVRRWDLATGKLLSERRFSHFSLPWYDSTVQMLEGTLVFSSFLRDQSKEVDLWDLATGERRGSVSDNRDIGSFLAISADGLRLATGNHTILLFDTSTGQKLQELHRFDDTIRCAAFAPDGKTIATGSGGHLIRLWDVATGKELWRQRGHYPGSQVTRLAFAEHGKSLASAATDGCVCLWDVEKGTRRQRLPVPSIPRHALAFSPDGKTLLTAGNDWRLYLWDVADGKQVGRIENAQEPFSAAVFTPDGKTVVAGGFDGHALAWDVAALRQAKPTKPEVRTDRYGNPLPPGCRDRLGVVGYKHSGQPLTFSADGKLLATAHQLDKTTTIRIWDAAAARELRHWQALEVSHVSHLALSPDGRTLAGADSNGVLLWDTATGRRLGWFFQIANASDSIYRVAFTPDGQRLIGAGGPIRMWDLETGDEVGRVKGHMLPIKDLAISPDGKRLLSRVMDNVMENGRYKTRLRLWDLVSEKELGNFPLDASQAVFAADGRILALPIGQTVVVRDLLTEKNVLETPTGLARLSPDGQALATQQGDGIHIWDVAKGKERRHWPGLTPDRWDLPDLSTDGKTLAVSGNHRLHLYDVETGKERKSHDGHAGPVNCLAYAPDGQRLASGGWDGVICLWGRDGRLVRGWQAHAKDVTAVVFAADGQTLASASLDGKVILGDPETGKLKCQILPEAGALVALDISPDGKLLVTGTAKEWAVWEAASGKLVRRVEVSAGRPESQAISPDGRWLATKDVIARNRLGHYEVVIRIQHLPTGKELRSYSTVQLDKLPVRWSPDGRLLATGIFDGGSRIRLWETGTGHAVLDLEAAFAPSSLAFAPDGRTLAVAGFARERYSVTHHLEVFSLVTGRKIASFPGHQQPITALTFSPDGQTLASSSEDNTILLWDLRGKTSPRHLNLGTLPPHKPEDLWKDLADADAATAYRTIWRLVADPQTALPLIAKHLSPAPPVDAERIAQLIGGLDSKKFAEREQAKEALEKLGEVAELALRKTLDGQPSLEVRRRVEALLNRLDRELSPEEARINRAIKVLEQIASADARRLLEDLAKGAPEARLTRDAKAALRRMK